MILCLANKMLARVSFPVLRLFPAAVSFATDCAKWPGSPGTQ